MKKIYTCLIFLGAVLSLIVISHAQYDSEVILPEYREGGEVFGIDLVPGKKVSMYPEGCESIERISIESKTSITGNIFIKKLEEKPDEAEELNNVYEYCEVELEDINENDIEVKEVRLRVPKSWLEDNDVSKGSISLFTLKDDDSWEVETTEEDNDTQIYYYYKSEASNFPYWAVGQHNGGLLGFLPSNAFYILLICCIFLIFLAVLMFIISSARESRREA